MPGIRPFSTTEPHLGQVASGRTVDGVRNLLQCTHHGTLPLHHFETGSRENGRGTCICFIGGEFAQTLRTWESALRHRGDPRSMSSTEVAPAIAFHALGTTAVLAITDPTVRLDARALLEDELAAIDHACSRFRTDSELVRVNTESGRAVPVSALFLEALRVALRAAAVTDGRVDPTIGRALSIVGYDRDFADVAPDGPPPASGCSRCPDGSASRSTSVI